MPAYLGSTVAFIGASLGCVFAPSAEVLVLFRALQGAGGEVTRVGQFFGPCLIILPQGGRAVALGKRQEPCNLTGALTELNNAH